LALPTSISIMAEFPSHHCNSDQNPSFLDPDLL
jgi:hypothetical protein